MDHYCLIWNILNFPSKNGLFEHFSTQFLLHFPLSRVAEAENLFILVFYLAKCGSSNTGCCTSTNLCAYGMGYCSTNADCQGNLICDSGSTNTCGK